VQVRDHLGKALEAKPRDGVLTVEASESVTYVTGLEEVGVEK
jgi:hypothetical protein